MIVERMPANGRNGIVSASSAVQRSCNVPFTSHPPWIRDKAISIFDRTGPSDLLVILKIPCNLFIPRSQDSRVSLLPDPRGTWRLCITLSVLFVCMEPRYGLCSAIIRATTTHISRLIVCCHH